MAADRTTAFEGFGGNDAVPVSEVKDTTPIDPHAVKASKYHGKLVRGEAGFDNAFVGLRHRKARS